MNITFTVDLLDPLLNQNPCCSSDIGTSSMSLLGKILVNSLRTKLSSVMFLKLLGLLFSPFLCIGYNRYTYSPFVWYGSGSNYLFKQFGEFFL